MTLAHQDETTAPTLRGGVMPLQFWFLLLAAVVAALSLAFATIGLEGFDRLLREGGVFIPTFTT